METFKSWAVSVVAAATIAAIISLLAPVGNFEKTIKIIVTLFVLASFIAPFVKSDIFDDFSGITDGMEEIIEENELENEVEEEIADSLKSAVESEISAYFAGKGIDITDIKTDVRIEDDNSIFVKRISIVLPGNTPTEEFENYISARFGVVPDFTFGSEVSDG